MHSVGVSEGAVTQTPLWNHMVNVLSNLVRERPPNALEAIGSISTRIETGSALPPKVRLGRSALPGKLPDSSARGDADVHLETEANFCDTLVPPRPRRRPLGGEDEEEDGYGADAGGDREEGEEVAGELSDIVAEQRVFNSLGEGLPPQEAFRVSVGLRRLLEREPLAKVRFWGKILSSAFCGYYVAEATVDENRAQKNADEDDYDADGDEPDEEAEDRARFVASVSHVLNGYAAKPAPAPPAEAAGQPNGVNQYRYYVALASDVTMWVQLPDATPETVAAARRVYRRFTGNLEAPVLCHPPFPGVEKHYLRAQIARITATCKVAPRDMYTTEGAVPEEDDEESSDVPKSAVGSSPASGLDSLRKAAVRLVKAYEEVPPLTPQELPDEEDVEAVAAVQAWFHGYKHDELLQGRNWVHISPTLLQKGRYTVEAPAVIQDRVAAARESAVDMGSIDGEGEEPEDELDLFGSGAGDDDDGVGGGIARFTERIHPFLSPLSDDEPLRFPGHSIAELTAWAFRKEHGSVVSGPRAFMARSLLWPGAFSYAVCKDGTPGAECQSVYIGDGVKNIGGVNLAPPLPPLRMLEFCEAGMTTQRDGTVDDELQYAPMPPSPPRLDQDEEDEEDMGED